MKRDREKEKKKKTHTRTHPHTVREGILSVPKERNQSPFSDLCVDQHVILFLAFVCRWHARTTLPPVRAVRAQRREGLRDKQTACSSGEKGEEGRILQAAAANTLS